jgi:hypothetical protein
MVGFEGTADIAARRRPGRPNECLSRRPTGVFDPLLSFALLKSAARGSRSEWAEVHQPEACVVTAPLAGHQPNLGLLSANP